MRHVCSRDSEHSCIRSNDKFCWKCGAKIIEAKDLICEKCENPYTENDHFCTSCGKPIK